MENLLKRNKQFVIISFFITVIFFSIFMQDAQAQVPTNFTYQGVLKDAGGNELTGTYNLLFKIYEAETGGTDIWQENHIDVNVDEGVFSVVLENLNSITFDQQYWLGIIVSGGEELSPRTKLTAVPYALMTKALPDNGVSTSKITNGAVTPEKINTSGASSGHALIYNGSTLNWGTPTGGGLTLPYSGTYSGSDDVFAITNTGTNELAIFEISNSNNAQEVLRLISNGTGEVLDIDNNGNDNAIYINNSTDSDEAIFIQNYANSEAIDVNNYGTYPAINATQYGVGDNCAEFRIDNTENDDDAIYATTNGTGYAGYFSGDVRITGTLTGGKSFMKIDHPLDPANKYLYHSSVESPDMMNVYNGNIMLNDNGEAIVELPEWFESLNMEYRYQLSCIGGYAPVYIAEEISDNSFKISGGTPGLKISWQITGIRQDPYANKNRISVEVEKTAKERGYYLHYKECNQPIEKSIEVAKDPEFLKEEKETNKK